VLRTYRLGEADRILVLMTAGRGKVRAVAKGVRKTGSRFGGRLEPGCHVRLLLYEGRQLDVVNQADSVEQVRGLRDDLTRLRDALALLEAVDQVAQEGESNRALFDMLVGALRTLGRTPSPLLVAGFYWKLLALEGSAPLLDECVRCSRPVAGGPDGLGGSDAVSGPERPDPAGDPAGVDPAGVEVVALDPVEGGVICRVCQPVGGGRRSLTPAALDLIRQILGGGLGAALATPAGPVAAEVTDLATAALESHLERRLRVPRLLERHD
ncbi:MAG TPA: DNA repair protein RecO, partial [Acidimicrobiales bacterium]|nr:DNA repair protein RecO [Acidimicrobiales bacterium]